MKQDIRLSGRHIDNGNSSDTQNIIRCILMSKQLSKYRVRTHSRVVASDERVEYIKHMLCTRDLHLQLVGTRRMAFPRDCQSSKLQSYFHFFTSLKCNDSAQQISVGVSFD
jgi:hypothetical protein